MNSCVYGVSGNESFIGIPLPFFTRSYFLSGVMSFSMNGFLPLVNSYAIPRESKTIFTYPVFSIPLLTFLLRFLKNLSMPLFVLGIVCLVLFEKTFFRSAIPLRDDLCSSHEVTGYAFMSITFTISDEGMGGIGPQSSLPGYGKRQCSPHPLLFPEHWRSRSRMPDHNHASSSSSPSSSCMGKICS